MQIWKTEQKVETFECGLESNGYFKKMVTIAVRSRKFRREVNNNKNKEKKFGFACLSYV